MNREYLHLRCPEPIHAAVLAQAKKEDLTPAEWVREAIRMRLREVGLKPPFWNEDGMTNGRKR